MLLACPNCNTVFRIEKTAIGKGRKVNCGVCKHVWFVNQDNLIEEKKATFTNEELFKEKKPIQKNSESKNQIICLNHVWKWILVIWLPQVMI